MKSLFRFLFLFSPFFSSFHVESQEINSLAAFGMLVNGVWKADNSQAFKTELQFNWSVQKRFVYTTLTFKNYEDEIIAIREGVYVWNADKKIVDFWNVDVESSRKNSGMITIDGDEFHFKEYIDGESSKYFSSKFKIIDKNHFELHWLQRPDGVKYNRDVVHYYRD